MLRLIPKNKQKKAIKNSSATSTQVEQPSSSRQTGSTSLHSPNAFFHKHLFIYLAVFALVGGLVLYKSFALNPNLPGDVNSDNTVNITDLATLLNKWATNNQDADLNQNGTVGIQDLSILLSHWGSSYTPPPPLPPPSGNKLMWSPPTLTNPITINVSENNRVLDLNVGQDYIIKMPQTALGRSSRVDMPALWVLNGRNVVIIGGEIRIDQVATGTDTNYRQRGIILSGQKGIVHIEGLWIHGAGMGQAISFDSGRDTIGTVQIENSRLESLHPVQYPPKVEVHTDAIQSWNGPTVLKLYQDTIISNGTVLQVQPRQYDSSHPLGTWDYRNVNFIHQTPDSYALWKASAKWSVYHENLWLKTNPNHVASDYHSAWAGEGNCWTCWNPGGSWPITGEAFNIGLRPTGDFAPQGVPGIGYVSPGYQ